MVMNMLSGDGRSNGLSLNGAGLGAGRVELSTLLLKASSDCGLVSVVDNTLLGSSDVVLMLLGKDLASLHGLNGGVVVILVDLTVCKDARQSQISNMPWIKTYQRQSGSPRAWSS